MCSAPDNVLVRLIACVIQQHYEVFQLPRMHLMLDRAEVIVSEIQCVTVLIHDPDCMELGQ